MSKNNDELLDELIKKSLTEMIDGQEVNIDVEEAWKRFQARAENQGLKLNRKRVPRLYKIALVASVAIVLAVAFVPNQVIAFKDHIYTWISRSDNGPTMISENINPEIKPGKYKNLDFEWAQTMTIFYLKYPSYLPTQIGTEPQIEVDVDIPPYAQVTMDFTTGEKRLIIKQENLGEEASKNTFIPQNSGMETITIDNKEITVVNRGENFQAAWIDSSIKFTLLAKGLLMESVEKIIKGLK